MTVHIFLQGSTQDSRVYLFYHPLWKLSEARAAVGERYCCRGTEDMHEAALWQ